MFAKTSLAGNGLIILLVGLTARLLGIDLDDKDVTEIATATTIVLGFCYMVAGQLMRDDLKWGYWRKTPIE